MENSSRIPMAPEVISYSRPMVAGKDTKTEVFPPTHNLSVEVDPFCCAQNPLQLNSLRWLVFALIGI